VLDIEWLSPNSIFREVGELVAEFNVRSSAHTPILLNLVRERRKALQRRWILPPLRLIHATCNDVLAKGVPGARHEMRVEVLLVLHEVDGRIDELAEGRGHEVRNAAPHVARREDLHAERGHDAEVVEAASQGFPKIGTFFGVGVHSLAGREDDFEVDDGVTCEAPAGGVEGQAAWSCQRGMGIAASSTNRLGREAPTPTRPVRPPAVVNPFFASSS
jgi:hypothetical protein